AARSRQSICGSFARATGLSRNSPTAGHGSRTITGSRGSARGSRYPGVGGGPLLEGERLLSSATLDGGLSGITSRYRAGTAQPGLFIAGCAHRPEVRPARGGSRLYSAGERAGAAMVGAVLQRR